MKRPHRQLLTITLLFVVGICFAAGAADTERLYKDVVPTFETVNLKIDPRQPNYEGNVSIALKVNKTTNSFIFHAEEMEIVDLILSDKNGVINAEQSQGEFGRRTIITDKMLEPGDYNLGISFTANYNTQAVGLYKTEVGGESYLFTQFEESDARKAFPCFDEPSFKIPFQLTVTIPNEQIAVSNTPIEIQAANGDWQTITFKKTEPLPSYLVALTAGPLETVDLPGMSIPGRVVCVKGKSGLTGLTIEMTPPLLKALEEYFGRPYPYEKLDLIAVPEFWAGAMENAGCITFRETILLSDPNSITVGQKVTLSTVMAHELAHMWFGDLVTMEWWDDLWLNESFASWMGDKIAHQVYPNLGIEISTVETGLRAMVGDARPTAIAIRPPKTETATLLGNIGAVYSKGQAVLLMIERWLGDETFRKGINLYLSQNEWGNATASDLWSALSEVSGKDVESALGTFIVQPGVPLVTIEFEGANSLRLKQERFMNYGNEAPEDLQWEIPVSMKYSDGQETKTISLLMSKEEETVKLETKGEVKWLFPNTEAAGYYRWKIPNPMLLNLCENAQNYLTSKERIGLIRNLSALLDAGEISGGKYLETLGLFAGDTSPVVIDNLISGIGKVKESLVPDELEDEYAVYIDRTLEPAIKRFGLEAKPGESEEVTLLRPGLIGVLADEGENEGVESYLISLAKKYLADPMSIDPTLAGLSLRTYAKNGDMKLFEDYKQRFETAQIPADRQRLLWCLGAFEDSAIIETALDYSLKGEFSAQETMAIPYMIGNIDEEHEMKIFHWMMANYDVIAKRLPKTSLPRMASFGGGCSKEKLAEAREFFTEESRYDKETEQVLTRVTAQVNDCVNLREREGASVAEFLNKFAATHQ